MKKWHLGLIVILPMFILSGCSTTDKSFDYGKFSFNEIAGGYEMTQSFSFWNMNEKYEGILNIPEIYKGKRILEISSMGNSFGRGITRIVGSENLETIRAWTFAGQDGYAMPNLESVEFPENGKLKSIETMAFYWCENLHTVILPNEFLSLDGGVFERCYNLENLIIYNESPPIMNGDIFNSDASLVNDKYWHTKPNEKFTVYVPNDSVETYRKSSWGNYSINPISSFDRD